MKTEQPPLFTWASGPDDLSLVPGEVHVWAVLLTATDAEREECLRSLSERERETAMRFVQDVHRNRFIVAHGVLRKILARYVGKPALSLEFRFGANGKPELAGELTGSLYFNLAHSENLALVAVGTNPNIGVDVERVRWLNDFDELVGRFFSPREAALFHPLASDLKPQAFFNLWTRKEAWLKATGEGIGYSLNRVEVTFLGGEEARVLRLPPGQDDAHAQWALVDLAPAEGFIGALAVKAGEVRVKCWTWNGKAPDSKIQHSKKLQDSTSNGTTTSFPQSPPPRHQGEIHRESRQTRIGLPIAILGVRFDNVTIAQAVGAIENMIASREPHYLVTANVDFVVQAQSDIELRRIFFDAHMVLCDGTPLLWASKLLGNPLHERVAGADIVPLLIESAAERGYRLFFLGASPESLGHAMENLRNRYPGLVIAGSYSPPFRQLLEMDHEEIRRRVTEAKADVLFVSLGCPKQEKWVAMNYRNLGVPVTIGVGATIDFLAGHVRRAPVWMQRSGLEWLYRLAQEPRRLYRRYSKDIAVFGWRLVAQLIRMRQRKTLNFKFETLRKVENQSSTFETARSANSSPPKEEGRKKRMASTSTLAAIPRFGHDSLKISGRLDADSVRSLLPSFEHVLTLREDSFLDLSGVVAMDSTGVAMLMWLQKNVRALGRRLVFLAPSSAVTDALTWMQLEAFFDIAAEIPVAERMIERRVEESLHAVLFDLDQEWPTVLWQGEITAANVETVWEETQPHITRLKPDSGTEALSLTIDLAGVQVH